MRQRGGEGGRGRAGEERAAREGGGEGGGSREGEGCCGETGESLC